MRRGIALSVSAALGLIVMASGCGSAQPDSSATYTYDAEQAGVAVDTADLRAAKAAAGIEPCPRSDLDATADDGDMPALVLPCLGGGDDVNLAGLGTPTVLNLWAQYCAPCREEAPGMVFRCRRMRSRSSVLRAGRTADGR